MADTETAPKYHAVLTDSGAELEARAIAEKKRIVLTHIVFGDANLNVVSKPSPSVKKLVHEVYRCPIDSMTRDENDPKIALLHGTIPANIGGFWINEIGVVGYLGEETDKEVLYGYGNHARYYKVLPQEGQSLIHTVIIPIVQCTNAEIILNINDTGYCTERQYASLAGFVKWFAEGCYEKTAVWTLTADIANNGYLALPNELGYIPNVDVVDLYYDGVACYPGYNYNVVSADTSGYARKFKLLFAAEKGSEFQLHIRHSGGIGNPPAEMPFVIGEVGESTNFVHVFDTALLEGRD